MWSLLFQIRSPLPKIKLVPFPMAFSSCLVLLKKASILITLILFFLQTDAVLGCYASIFSFGDSLIDTGNFNNTDEDKHSCMKPPYGVTYFGRPTGRCSDGRLVIDFIAQGLGLPFLPAYLRHTNIQDFKQGANFAVGGATALDVPFLNSIGIKTDTNHSLRVQIGWFKDLLPSLCGSPSRFKNGALRTCCGGGGRYNYNASALCGDEGSSVCDDITSYVNWDGNHYTENAYKWMATGLLGPYTTPHINPSCISLKSSYGFDHPIS